jgi:para-aminobenzoate synthetase component 1
VPFSGSLLYNATVEIRSIFIDVEAKKLCFNVGSAITINSDPEQEYEECLLKAKAIFETLL